MITLLFVLTTGLINKIKIEQFLVNEHFNGCSAKPKSGFIGNDEEEKQSSCSGFTGNKENFGGCGSSKPHTHDDEKEGFSGSEVDVKVFLDNEQENFEDHEDHEEEGFRDPNKINLIDDHGSM